MRRALLLCILLLAGATASPALLPSGAGTPAPLPDLFIVPDDIFFTIVDITTGGALVGTPFVNVTVIVQDKGLDNITSANVTLYINGTLLGISPVVTDFAGEPGLLAAVFLWNTSSLPVGVYPVRAQANDSAGDADPSDNTAETNFTIVAGSPSLELELDSTAAVAEVTESSPGIARINGTLSVANLYGQLQVIGLNCRTEIGWTSSISPATFIASHDGNYSFNVAVSVPQGSRADRSGSLNISAVAQDLEVRLEVSVEATVTVKPYFRIQLSANTPFREITPGSQAFYTLTLTNQGNVNDSFSLEVVNLDALVKDHTSATLSCRTVEKLGPDESAAIRVVFSSAKDWTLWKTGHSDIEIRATSLGAQAHQEKISLTFFFWASEKGSYPEWYNWSTVILAIIIVAAAVVTGFWNRRRKRKKAASGAGK
jgi:hypothetical protein